MAALLCPGGLGFNRKGDKYGLSREEYMAMPLETRLLQDGCSDMDSRALDIEARTSNLSMREGGRLPNESLIFLQVVEDFFPTSALEIPVRRGEFVKCLCYEGSWLFVQTQNGANGYIPRRHCRITELQGISARPRSHHSQSSEFSDVGYFSDNVPISIPAYLNEPSISSGTAHSTDSDGRGSSSSGSLVTTPEQQRKITVGMMLTPGGSKNTIEQGLFQRAHGRKKRECRPSELVDEILTRSVTTNIPVCGRRCSTNCMHQQSFRRRAHTEETQKHRNTPGRKAQPELHQSPHMTVDNNLNMPDTAVHFEKVGDQRMTTAVQTNRHLQAQATSKAQNNIDRVHKEPTTQTAKNSCNHPQLIVIEEYAKQAKTDVTVQRGDFATLLDDTNPTWTYVQTEDGRRGYVPKDVIINHKCENCFTSAPVGVPIVLTPANQVVDDVLRLYDQRKDPASPSLGVATDVSLDGAAFSKFLVHRELRRQEFRRHVRERWRYRSGKHERPTPTKLDVGVLSEN